MTKAAKKTGKAIKKRVAKQAVAESFGAKVAEKAVEAAPEAPASAPEASPKPYMIFVDKQAAAYLRVEQGKKSDFYIINTGAKTVDLIEMDSKTAKSRGLEAVPEASVLDAAKVLAKPLNSGIIVSERAQKYLNQILADQELIEMANKKATAKTKKGATKSTARAKSGATGTRAADTAIVKFKKAVKDGDLPKQAATIVGLVQKAGELTVAKLLEKMEGQVVTKQPMKTIFSFYKTKLVSEGYLTVTAAS